MTWGWPTHPGYPSPVESFFALFIFATFLIAACLYARHLWRASKLIEEPAVIAPHVLVVCPYCGAKNEQGILYCQRCGGKV